MKTLREARLSQQLTGIYEKNFTNIDGSREPDNDEYGTSRTRMDS